MPIPVALNIYLRNRVRQSMVLPRALDVPLDADVATDTTDEQKKKLQAAKVIPTASQAALDDSRAQQAAARQPLGMAPARLINLGGANAVIGSATLRTTEAGPIGYPFTIEHIQLTVANVGVPPATDDLFFTILISSNTSRDLTQLQLDQNIVLSTDFISEGIRFAHAATMGQDVTELNISLAHPSYDVPVFLKAVHRAQPNLIAPSFNVIIREETPLLSPGLRFTAPVGRINININTAPPPARSSTPPTPRAAEISVTQGGRILSSRVVAWQSLPSTIRNDWYNRQVGGVGDPSIRWIP